MHLTKPKVAPVQSLVQKPIVHRFVAARKNRDKRLFDLLSSDYLVPRPATKSPSEDGLEPAKVIVAHHNLGRDGKPRNMMALRGMAIAAHQIRVVRLDELVGNSVGGNPPSDRYKTPSTGARCVTAPQVRLHSTQSRTPRQRQPAPGLRPKGQRVPLDISRNDGPAATMRTSHLIHHRAMFPGANHLRKKWPILRDEAPCLAVIQQLLKLIPAQTPFLVQNI